MKIVKQIVTATGIAVTTALAGKALEAGFEAAKRLLAERRKKKDG